MQPHPSIWAFLALRLPPERIEALQEALKRQLKGCTEETDMGEYKDLGVSYIHVRWIRRDAPPDSPIRSAFNLYFQPSFVLVITSIATGIRLASGFDINFYTDSGQVHSIIHRETTRDIINVFCRKALAHKAARRSH